jgi:FKBP-type peptidyl-prolyl cis-trans isomerase
MVKGGAEARAAGAATDRCQGAAEGRSEDRFGIELQAPRRENSGLQARPDESVMIRYTGWRQNSGETFFTTGREGESITVNPAYAAPAFREVIPLLHKGEKIVVWVPSGGGMPEPAVYEIELVDVGPKPSPTYSALH